MSLDFNYIHALGSDSFPIKESAPSGGMEAFHCTFIIPARKLYDGEVTSVIAPSTRGMINVWSRHASIVTSLTKGLVRLTHKGKSFYFVIESGALEVNSATNTTLIMASNAEPAANLDEINQKFSQLLKK